VRPVQLLNFFRAKAQKNAGPVKVGYAFAGPAFVESDGR